MEDDGFDEVFNIDNFVGEDTWDAGDPAAFFDLNPGLYEVGGIHYVEYDSGCEVEEEDEIVEDYIEYDSSFGSE